MHSTPTADGVCSTSRLLPFAPSQVVAAFADPRQLATWWGPDGFRNSFEVFEFKAQGRWLFTMHGPDGTDYQNECLFLEAGPADIVIRHLSQPHFTLTVSLAERAGHTLVQWHQAFDDPKLAASIWHIIQPANEQNLNRLHQLLAARPE
jgi:uncharacterized protein YndB with AHSA1/START domain